MEKKRWFGFVTVRRTLLAFVVLSIGLHLMLAGGGVVSEKLAQMRQERLAEMQRREAQLRKEKATALKAELAKKALEQNKEEVKSELKRQFDALVEKDIKGNAADEIWDKVLAQLQAQLDDVSQELGDERLSDADVHDKMVELQGEMLDEMLKELREMGAKRLADGFVDRVKSDVAPRLADYYRQNIDRNIGTALREAGTKIINQDVAAVRGERQTAGQSLVKAEGQVKAAQVELSRAQQHLEQQDKALAAAKTEAQKTAVQEAVKGDQTAAGHAADAIKAAQKLVQAVAGADSEAGDNVKKAIQAAAAHGDAAGAVEQAGAAGKAAAEGKIADAAVSAGDAAKKAGGFAEAIHAARMVKDNSDPALAARRGVKEARDEHIKGELDEGFRSQVVAESVPRMAEGLADGFKKTLDDAGIKDDGAVKDVKKRIEAALGDAVKGEVKAGETGTGQLTRAGKLDEAGGKSDGKGAGTQMAGAGKGGEAGDGAGDGGVAADGDAHERAVAEKMNLAANEIGGKGMADLAGDGGADKIAAAAANGKGAAGGADGDGEGLSALSGRIARLAGLVKGGQGELGGDGGMAVGPGAGSGGAGGAGGSGGGLGGMRQSAFGRSRAVALLRDDYYGFDYKKYQEMTAGIHTRDLAAAQGQAIALNGASGESGTDVTTLATAAKEQPQAASILVPADNAAQPLLAIAEKKEPYKPSFDNIRFAAIPYLAKPITMDGDLAEWKNVPAIPMAPVVPATAVAPAVMPPPLEIKVQWDHTGIYVAYDVKKAAPGITKVKTQNFWEGDAVEIFVDTLNTKEKERNLYTQQFWFWPDGAADDPAKVGGEAVHLGRHEERNAFGQDLIQTASKQTAAGWTMEVHIPRERFHKIDMQPGRIVGMNFSICTGSPVYYYWAGNMKTGTWGSPDTWGDVLFAGSDSKLECVDRLASELKQSEEAKPVSWLRIGDPLRIRVTSPVMNLSDRVIDKITVSVASRHGGRQEVVLDETGKNTGIFEGAIATALETGDPVLNTLTLYEGETVDIAYNDQCRADGARNVRVKLSIPTASGVARSGQK